MQKNYTVKQAAKALGIPVKTLRNWVNKYRTSPEGASNVAQHEKLERENRRLKAELKWNATS